MLTVRLVVAYVQYTSNKLRLDLTNMNIIFKIAVEKTFTFYAEVDVKFTQLGVNLTQTIL